MAGMRDVCGAVSGMFMAYGLLCGPADPTDRAAKTNNYAALRQLAGEFEARNGSIICRQLLGLDPNVKPQPPEPRTDILSFKLAGVVGLEPTSTVLETAILAFGRYP